MFTEAAIKFKIDDEWVIYTGERHHVIILKIARDGLTQEYKATHIDGFIYNNEFIDRETATKIAKEKGIPMVSSILTSEDLW